MYPESIGTAYVVPPEGQISVDKGVSVFPTSVDLNPTGKCNLDCSFCWGPEHDAPDRLSTGDWQCAIEFFASGGTKGTVFTGGEPLVRKDIGTLLRTADENAMNVTLSTNALLLQKKADEVLPYIDEIGIPLDGSTAEKNARMRLTVGMEHGHMGHFQTALDALGLVRAYDPSIETTVRTVASKVNVDDLTAVGHLLEQRGEQVDRWKIYQFVPVSIGAAHREEHEISDDDFQRLGDRLQSEFPQLNIRMYPSRERIGRYVFIGPDGSLFGVGPSGDYEVFANFLDSPLEQVFEGMRNLVDPSKNARHARAKNMIYSYE